VGTPPRVNRLQRENFDKDSQDMIESLASSLNPFMEQTRNCLDKRIDFNNLNQELINFTLSVDASGIPKTAVQWKSNLLTNVAGCQVISAIGEVYPTGAPFVTFLQNANIVTVQHVTGLPADVKFKFTVLSIGK
jgi:hypothetical protein